MTVLDFQALFDAVFVENLAGGDVTVVVKTMTATAAISVVCRLCVDGPGVVPTAELELVMLIKVLFWIFCPSLIVDGTDIEGGAVEDTGPFASAPRGSRERMQWPYKACSPSKPKNRRKL